VPCLKAAVEATKMAPNVSRCRRFGERLVVTSVLNIVTSE
jgi:hypothetical protein